MTIGSTPRSRPRAGFTLLEVLVTISMVVLLTGLTLSVLSSMTLASEIRSTENTLRLLDTAVDEWQQQSSRTISWGQDDSPPGASYDVQGQLGWQLLTEEVFVLTEILAVVSRNPAANGVLTKIDQDLVYRFSEGTYPDWVSSPTEKQQQDERFVGEITILDAWGEPIYATHPGRTHTDDDSPSLPDVDGTVRTYNEIKYGSALNRRIMFVSAGPDGDFGNRNAVPGSELAEATEDNLFSVSLR